MIYLDEDQMINLEISFRGESIVLEVDSNESISGIKQKLEKISNVKAEKQKLIYKGKTIENANTSISELNPLANNKVKFLLIGSTEKEIISVNENPKIRVKNDLNGEIVPKGYKKQSLNENQKIFEPNQFCFEKVEALKGLPNEKEAFEILSELSNDIGILAVMKKHKWTVNLLTELFPKGKVGKSEVCLMGLNENKGQTIRLRIRTDDLKGFRKVLSIKKVLFHELAHNVFTGHDQNFFGLLRQIEKEAEKLDYRQNFGRSLNSKEIYLRNDSKKGYLLVKEAFEGGSGKLGGTAENDMKPKEMAAKVFFLCFDAF